MVDDDRGVTFTLVQALFWLALILVGVVIAIFLLPVILVVYLLARMDPRWGHEDDETESDF